MTTTTSKKATFDQQRDAITASINNIFAVADEQKRSLTAQELQQIAALESAFDALGAKPRPLQATRDQPGEYSPGYQRPESTTRTGSKRAAELFRDHSPEDCGFSSLSDFAGAIAFGNGSRLAAVAGNSKGVPSDGGFSLPTSLQYALLDGSLESEIVRPRANVVAMTAETHTYWDYDNSTHADGKLFGNLEGVWASEGDDLDIKVAKMRQIKLNAKKLAFLTSASNELLSDSPDFERRLSERMQQTVSFNFDTAFLTDGTGAGQPRSILNDPSLITISKETGQPASTIVYENLVKMFARMHPGCLGNAVWVFNSTCLPQLLQLSIPIGTAGAHVAVMSESGGQYRILGRPVVFSEKMKSLGTLGDCFLCDFSQYLIGVMANGIRLSRSDHVYFSSDQVVWRIIARVEGMGTWKSAVTPLNGDSLSPFVTLAARA